MKYILFFLLIGFSGCDIISRDSEYETFTIVGEKIQIAKEDFPNKMNPEEAIKACEMLGNGWRLPTIMELNAIQEQLQKNGKGDFKKNYYLSSDGEDLDSNGIMDAYYCLDSAGGMWAVHLSDFLYVRAVRPLSE